MPSTTIPLHTRSLIRQDPSRATAHSDLMALPATQDAIRIALLEYQDRLTASDAPTNPAAAFLKLQGARQFVHILLNLAMPDATSTADTATQPLHDPGDPTAFWNKTPDAPPPRQPAPMSRG